MIETLTAEAWLYSVLTGDAGLLALAPADLALRVRDGVAPEGTPMPFVVFQYQGGADLKSVGSHRWGHSALYVVKAVGEGQSYDVVRPWAEAIDAALHRASGSVVGEGDVWGCIREGIVKQTDPEGFRHLGVEVRLWATSTG